MDKQQSIPIKKELLERIIKARESIKHKHLALKLGRENAEQMISENLKPITKPLEKIEKFTENFENPSNDKSSFLQLPSSTPFKKRKKEKSTFGFKTANETDEENSDNEEEKNGSLSDQMASFDNDDTPSINKTLRSNGSKKIKILNKIKQLNNTLINEYLSKFKTKS